MYPIVVVVVVVVLGYIIFVFVVVVLRYLKVEQDGRVYLFRPLDVDYGTLISMTVEARDHGTPARTSTAIIDIIWVRKKGN
jgi:hypothetical protein